MEWHALYPKKSMTSRILPRSFYARATAEVARDLLGKTLALGACAGLIVETEAYLGEGDPAAHSAAGLTDRTRVIFGPPGHAYVYLSYGVHECFNITAEPGVRPGCVLIRALEPTTGLDLMRARRPAARTDRDLTNGPGKLTQALGITRQHYGRDLTRGDLVVRDSPGFTPTEVIVTPRIGITKAVDLPLRFLLRRN
jgi:DNA-3-methyladenine glycosylase